MNSRRLRRSMLATLVGLALLTTGCAPDDATQPTASPSRPAETAAPSAPGGEDSPDETSTAEPAPDADAECATPPAGSPAGTPADPYTVGDEIVLDCFTLVVTELVPDATTDVLTTDPNAAPSDGNVFAVVKVMVARTGGGPGDVGEIGIRYAPARDTVVDADPDLRLEEQSPPAGTLSPGQASGGTLVFDAPASGEPLVVLTPAGGAEVWVAPSSG